MRSAGAEEAFVSRSVSDAVDFSGDGGWSRAGALCAWLGCIRKPLSKWNDQYPYRYRADHHDVSAAGEGALREAWRSVSQEARAGAIASAELADRPGVDVCSGRLISSRRTGLHAGPDPDRHCALHCDGAGVERTGEWRYGLCRWAGCHQQRFSGALLQLLCVGLHHGAAAVARTARKRCGCEHRADREERGDLPGHSVRVGNGDAVCAYSAEG